jgi:hypothetical protein
VCREKMREARVFFREVVNRSAGRGGYLRKQNL